MNTNNHISILYDNTYNLYYMRIHTIKFKNKYIKLLKLKHHFEKHIISILKQHRFTLFTNKQFRLNENEIDIMIKNNFNKYNTIDKEKNKLMCRKKQNTLCFRITVSFYEYLRINYNINKYHIISYINNNNNWYYPSSTLIKIPIKELLLKNINNVKIISDNITQILDNKLHKIYTNNLVLNNPQDNTWHIDNDYNSIQTNNILVISESMNGKLGTRYYEIPKLNCKISWNNELSYSIYQCCNKLSITWLEKNKRCNTIPENNISNITSIYYHRTPFNKNNTQRTLWVFD